MHLKLPLISMPRAQAPIPCRLLGQCILMACVIAMGWPGASRAQETNYGANPSGQPAQPPAAPPPGDPPPAAPSNPPVVSTPEGTVAEVPFEATTTPEEEARRGGPAPLTGESEPLSKARPESPKATLIIKQMDIDQVFDRIRQQTGVRVTSEGQAKGQKIDLVTRDTPLEDILNSIATPRQWMWVKNDDGSYAVMDKDTYVKTVQARQVLRRPFQLRYIDAEELDKIIQPILTPEIGASSPDARTNKLIVTDLPDKIALIESIIEEYDVQLYTRVFEVVHAQTEEVADRLGEIKSKAAEIQVDPPNRTIVVKDTFEKIKQMEQLVEILDRDQEIRIYNINNIGIDSEVAQELIETFITPIVTEDAVVEFNEPTGKLFVKDVRTVHDKILDILKQIDRPRKQVLIEGEILSVLIDNTLSFGANWVIADDLNAAIAAGQPGTGGDGAVTNQAGLPLGTISSSGLNFINLTNDVRVQLNAAMTDSRTRLLLRPRLLIANHEEGSFNVTTNEPILQTFFDDGTNNNSSFRSSGQTTVETGLIVQIIPHISNRGLIELETRFENSTPRIVPDIGNGQRGVGTNVESAETFLIIPSGQTRVIGGLIRHNEDEGRAGVPVLANIPYLGWLFGSRTNDRDQRDLMFFLTPSIVEEQPLNDIIVEPVNEAARISMTLAAHQSTSDTLNPIPEELRPYLESIRPEAIPMSEEGMTDGATTSTEQLDAGGSAYQEATPGAMTEEAGANGESLLTSEAYVDPAAVEQPKVGGAVVDSGGVAGPKGAFGTTAKQVGRPAPTPPKPRLGQPSPPKHPAQGIPQPPVQPPGNAQLPANTPQPAEPAPTPTPAPPPPPQANVPAPGQ